METCPHEAHAEAVSLLQKVYKDSTSGFGADFTDEDLDPQSLQYGEVTYAGMEPFFSVLDLQPNDVFYDLGSGTGKVVLYVALRRMLSGQSGLSAGMEVGERRHATACAACEELKSKCGQGLPEVSMLLQDVSRHRFRDASVVLLNNLCLNMTITSRTLDNLLKCPTLKRIVCVTQLAPNSRLKFVNAVQVPCTWCKKSSWQVYDVLPAKPAIPRPRSVMLTPTNSPSREKLPLLRTRSARCRRNAADSCSEGPRSALDSAAPPAKELHNKRPISTRLFSGRCQWLAQKAF